MIFQQSAFRAGSLTASLPTITVAKPIVAVILGVAVLKESLRLESVPERALLIALTVLVIVATVMLARGEAASIEDDEEHDMHDVTAGDEPNKVPSEPSGDGRLPGSAPTG
ncbi:DMT family transporter [Mycobacterium intracellulare]|uniref:DMT family transporter n=1 Tax=Mycobacterium intracellulare TaxID=1767 RepID=UPI00128FB8D5